MGRKQCLITARNFLLSAKGNPAKPQTSWTGPDSWHRDQDCQEFPLFMSASFPSFPSPLPSPSPCVNGERKVQIDKQRGPDHASNFMPPPSLLPPLLFPFLLILSDKKLVVSSSGRTLLFRFSFLSSPSPLPSERTCSSYVPWAEPVTRPAGPLHSFPSPPPSFLPPFCEKDASKKVGVPERIKPVMMFHVCYILSSFPFPLPSPE